MAFIKWAAFSLIILGIALRIWVDFYPSSLPFSDLTIGIVSILMIILGALLSLVGQKPQMIPVPVR